MEVPPSFKSMNGKPLSPMHHLAKNVRGRFVMKVTVESTRRNHVGERLTVQLRTTDPETAMAKRDTAIEVLKMVGVLCRDITIQEEM